jgi:hypothetical protein
MAWPTKEKAEKREKLVRSCFGGGGYYHKCKIIIR